MLSKIKLKNFLSYEDEEVDVSGSSTIAVIGDNGHGKSALLEAVYYAYYGKGRDSVSGLIRENSDGDMLVSIDVKDFPKAGDTFSIERGVREWKKSFAVARINGELEAKGVESVNQFVEEVTGFDSETFLLTTFFGLGENDNLMQVRPSVRLETMQRIANVLVYEDFNAEAVKRLKRCSADMMTKEADIEALQSVCGDSKEIKESTEARKKELGEKNEELDNLYAEQAKITAAVDRITGFLKEKEALQIKRKNAKSELKRVDQEISDYGITLQEAKGQIGI